MDFQSMGTIKTRLILHKQAYIFSQKMRIDSSCELSHKEIFCMKCQFSGRIKKKDFKLSSVESVQRVVKPVKSPSHIMSGLWYECNLIKIRDEHEEKRGLPFYGNSKLPDDSAKQEVITETVLFHHTIGRYIRMRGRTVKALSRQHTCTGSDLVFFVYVVYSIIMCTQRRLRDQPGHPPNLIRVIAVRLVGS